MLKSVVDSLANKLSGTSLLRLNYIGVFIFTLIFSYIVHDTKMPGRETGVAIFVILCYWLFKKYYSNYYFEFSLKREDLAVYATFVILQLLLHIPTLSFSLGGDELWHAEKSNFVLTKFGQMTLSSPLLAATLGSLMTPDLWRFLSLPILGFFALIFLYVKYALAHPKRDQLLLTGLLVLSALSYWWQVNVDNHPPMRLLPVFISQMVFGLNNFAFRVPGLFAAAIAALIVFKHLRPQYSFAFSFFAGLLAVLMPQVFYSAESVEPSIYAYVFWLAITLQLVKYSTTHEPNDLILAAALTGLGVLFRHTTILLWLPIGFFALKLYAQGKRREHLIQVFLPFLLCVPYLFTVKNQGHGAFSQEPFTTKVASLLTESTAWWQVVESTTLFWFVFAVALVAWVQFKTKWQYKWLLPLYLVLFLIYNLLIVMGFWGVGRYQTEYFCAGVIAHLALMHRLSLAKGLQTAVIAFSLLASVYAVENNLNIADDMSFTNWPQMKITTSSHFPYREAFTFIKRQDAGPRLLVLGGSPFILRSNMWLSNFSILESEQWYLKQSEFQKMVENPHSLNDILQYVIQNKIEYIAVQWGTKRELQHRTPALEASIRSLQSKKHDWLNFVMNFGPENGGIISVYKVVNVDGGSL